MLIKNLEQLKGMKNDVWTIVDINNDLKITLTDEVFQETLKFQLSSLDELISFLDNKGFCLTLDIKAIEENIVEDGYEDILKGVGFEFEEERVREVNYEENGSLITEKYRGNKLVEEYEYIEGNLVREVKYNLNGAYTLYYGNGIEVLYSDFKDLNGRIKIKIIGRLTSIYDYEKDTIVGIRAYKDFPQTDILEYNDTIQIGLNYLYSKMNFNSKGKLQSVEKYDDGTLVEVETYDEEEGGYPIIVTRYYYSKKRVIKEVEVVDTKVFYYYVDGVLEAVWNKKDTRLKLFTPLGDEINFRGVYWFNYKSISFFAIHNREKITSEVNYETRERYIWDRGKVVSVEYL